MARQTAKAQPKEFVLPRNKHTEAALQGACISTYYRYINSMFWLLRYSGEVDFDEPTPLDLIVSHGSFMARNLDKVVYDRSEVPAYSDVDNNTGLTVDSQELVQSTEDRNGLSATAYQKVLEQAGGVIDLEKILEVFKDLGFTADPSQFRQMAYNRAVTSFWDWKRAYDERQKSGNGSSKFVALTEEAIPAADLA